MMADSKNNQRGERGPELTLLLDVSEPQKKDGIWEVIATATVLFRRKYAPDPQREVVFFLNNEEAARDATDAESGRVSTAIEIPKTGSYVVAAFLSGLPGVRGTKRISVKEETPSPPKLLPPIVRAEGNAGDYLVSVLVSDEQRRPVKDVYIRFLISPRGRPADVQDEETDETGFAIHHLTFGEQSCNVTVQVAGFEMELKNLQGYSRTPKPREYKRPDEAILAQGSVLDVIRRAWERGVEDRKGEE